ncbi:hypothetical protein [Kribbella swartbergensis]
MSRLRSSYDASFVPALMRLLAASHPYAVVVVPFVQEVSRPSWS